MLNHRNSITPAQRQPPILPTDFSAQHRAHYILPAGNSKASGEIHVTYVARSNGANGDLFEEEESVSVSFDYPIGKTRKVAEFSVRDRNYGEIYPVYQDQEAIPNDVLEILAEKLPRNVRRILPDLPK